MSLMLLLYMAVSWSSAGEQRSLQRSLRVCAASGILLGCPLHLLGGVLSCAGGADESFFLFAAGFLCKSIMCFSFSLLPPPPRLPAERQQGPSPFYPQLSASRGAANFSADDILAAIPPLPPLSLSPAEISPSPLAPAQHHADHHHHLHLHHHQHHHLARENSEDESELSSTVLISEVSHRHSCEHDEEDDDVEIKCKDESLIGLPALQLHNKLETSAGHLSLHMSHRVAFTGSPLVPPRRVRLFRRDLQNMQENSKDNSEDNSKENQKDNSNNKSKDSSEDSSDKNSNQSSNANGSNIRDIMAMIESEADSENAVIKRSEDAGNEKLSSNTFARCEDVRMRVCEIETVRL
uniref:Uncharacterized protein n=1 Tax=Hanusia phi TaxID=3032 RepID=A0A7S0E322_9CRYP|mmetsp:Transcript_15800/g.36126  ORF Transcript_15800/g.36126 Transcript_15800/m.36126 type:complete len:351 (+) Transcript_15800:867-1919(+)